MNEKRKIPDKEIIRAYQGIDPVRAWPDG